MTSTWSTDLEQIQSIEGMTEREVDERSRSLADLLERREITSAQVRELGHLRRAQQRFGSARRPWRRGRAW